MLIELLGGPCHGQIVDLLDNENYFVALKRITPDDLEYLDGDTWDPYEFYRYKKILYTRVGTSKYFYPSTVRQAYCNTAVTSSELNAASRSQAEYLGEVLKRAVKELERFANVQKVELDYRTVFHETRWDKEFNLYIIRSVVATLYEEEEKDG